MAFYGHKGDAGESYSTPYSTTYHYDLVPFHSSPTCSAFDFHEPYLTEHDPHSYCNSVAIEPEINYYSYSFTESQLIPYEPKHCKIGYANYKISYSTQESHVPDFEEYDPTPYGGGYDSAEVYGKPLPPSAEICYPISEPQADGFSLEGFSYASIPSPYGKDDGNSIKINGTKQSDSTKDEPKSARDNGDKLSEKDGTEENDNVDSDHDGMLENEGIGEDGYGCSRQVSYIPYGSGLEAMDFCDTIFGYWPCLDKLNRERNGNSEDFNEKSNNDPWKNTADYLFGSPFAYGEQKDGGGYGDYAYN